MKLAFVYDSVYPWETGGVQKRLWELGRRLSDRHDVHWYGLKYWEGPRVVQDEGITFHGVMSPPDLYVDGRRSISEAVAFSSRLVGPLLREEFDLIDCQEFPYFPAFPSKLQSLRFQSTFILTWHEIWGDYWYDYLGWKGFFGKTIERLVASVPDTHLAVSDRTSRDLRQLGVTDVEIVPNGISMDEIDLVTPTSEQIDILYVGRLIPEKNVELLVESVDELQQSHADLRCVIVGDGPERTRLTSLIQDAGLQDTITLTGRLQEYEDVLARMKAADVFALPSRREGFGISALEALACGTPVVTISHPQNAAQELVVDGVTGAICEETTSSFARGLDRARANASPSTCIDHAREYDWDRISERIEQIYLKALERG